MSLRHLGMIAGNGQLPLHALREAVRQQLRVTVAAIKEEAEPEIERIAAEAGGSVSLHWVGLGQLGHLLKLFRQQGVDHALMVGQVRHVRIFAPGSRSPLEQLKHLPDWRMIQLLTSLPQKDTNSLIGGVIREIEREGIRFVESTVLLKRYLPESGVLTRRRPDREETRDIEYGRPLARELARLDLGQTIVVKNQAVVAVEAMEGTDETIRRAARLVPGQSLSVVKASRPNQDMRYDVPVIGLRTLDVMRECRVSVLCLDAGRTIILDLDRFLKEADESNICVVAGEPGI